MGSASSSHSKTARGSGAARGAKGGGGATAAATVAAPAPSFSSSEHGWQASSEDGWQARAAAAAAAFVEDCECENCSVMKSSPCREQYIKATACAKAALDVDLHPDRLCSHVAKDLRECKHANRLYYHLLDRAEEI